MGRIQGGRITWLRREWSLLLDVQYIQYCTSRFDDREIYKSAALPGLEFEVHFALLFQLRLLYNPLLLQHSMAGLLLATYLLSHSGTESKKENFFVLYVQAYEITIHEH